MNGTTSATVFYKPNPLSNLSILFALIMHWLFLELFSLVSMRFLVSMCSRFLSSVSFGFCFEGSLHDRRKFRSETSDNMDRWEAQPGESQKREDQTSTTTTTLQLQLHCAASNHLSVHQWVRSAVHDSQQQTSPIGFLSLKLPRPPCAVLLLFSFICL